MIDIDQHHIVLIWYIVLVWPTSTDYNKQFLLLLIFLMFHQFGNFLLNHRLFFLSGSDHWSDHFLMWVFPKVLILIMFMGGGAKPALGDPPKTSRFVQKRNIASRVGYRPIRALNIDYISPTPQVKNPEYAPERQFWVSCLPVCRGERNNYWQRSATKS